MNNFISGMLDLFDRVDDSHFILLLTTLAVICPGLLMLVVFFPAAVFQLDILKILLLTTSYGVFSLFITIIILLGVLTPKPVSGRSRYFWWVFAVFAMAGGVIDGLFIVLIYLLRDVFGVEKIGTYNMNFKYYIGFHILIFAVILPLWVVLTRKSLNREFNLDNIKGRNEKRLKEAKL